MDLCTKCGVPIPRSWSAGVCPKCWGESLLLAPPDPPPPPPGSILGDYELLEEVGRGGMGVVYKARQISLKRIVAVKVMTIAGPGASEEQRKRFQIEAEAAARLKHPNIVSIYQVGEYDGWDFIAMEFIEGGTLAGCLKDHTKRPRQDKRTHHACSVLDSFTSMARLLESVATAVHHAHQRGVLHLDLKPANILLDAAGEPYVTDFGLAEFWQEDASPTGSDSTVIVAGTLCCMSPERARGDSSTTVSDVYSLGAVLYYLLTGQPPFPLFEGESTVEVLNRVGSEEPAVPPWKVRHQVAYPNSQGRNTEQVQSLTSRFFLDIHRLLVWAIGSRPPDLDYICLKCLEKEPARRYASAKDLADELERFRGGKPIHARPPSMIEGALCWGQRHLAAVLGLVLLVGALLAASTLAKQGEEKLRQQLHSVAQLAANTVSSRLKDFSVPVTEMANLLRPLMEQPILETESRQETFLEAHAKFTNSTNQFNQGAGGAVFESWYLLDSNGVIVARAPDGPTRGKDFSMRDYFNGTKNKQPKPGVLPVHISRIYFSQDDRLYKFGICVPIFSTNRQAPVLGVLVATVSTQSTLGPLGLTNAQHQVVLVGRWDPNPHPEDDRKTTDHLTGDSFLILDHPALTNPALTNRSNVVEVPPGKVLKQLMNHMDSQDPELQLRPAAGTVSFKETVDGSYKDPLQEGERLAAFAQVAHTALAVIVQHNETRSSVTPNLPLKLVYIIIIGALALLLLAFDVARALGRANNRTVARRGL